ncbi:L,D-transpeptidase [Magnetospira sp. QH-2]|uniref:L,D-transpeptidase family protein n=1 Tax=Magnetospira sp. (strain QH-2) TaxID=1288970 RepID=UPI0003E8170C|nr:L,D-transpeptidase family protein [Magnetospira sp. QH-2]CCQ75598.1 conserved hypothetical protein[Include L, D-transpeptidase catalytic domain] [Magnetospira sp. QH-2]
MDLFVTADGFLIHGNRRLPCALGRGGINPSKVEGDGCTPVGRFPLRRVLYREDRLAPPETGLSVMAITPGDGWSDDPKDPAYNCPVSLPHDHGHEILWREDAIYDVIVVLGHNDDPVVPGAGSAVFLHVARPGFVPTEGCIALTREDLLAVLKACQPGDCLTISG